MQRGVALDDVIGSDKRGRRGKEVDDLVDKRKFYRWGLQENRRYIYIKRIKTK